MALLTDAKRQKFAAELLEHKTQITAIANGLLTSLGQRSTQLAAIKTAVEGDADFTASDVADVTAVQDHLQAEIQRVYAALTA